MADSDDAPKPDPSEPGGSLGARLRTALATPRGRVTAAAVALVVLAGSGILVTQTRSESATPTTT
ncbi:MAG: hypothetical protein PV358_16670, partial [Acidimicrobiales bacterium]|nr:hypothetical protein [Acidimicrobiales bacterium]